MPALYQLGLLSKTPKDDIGRLIAFTAACAFFGMSFAIPLRKWYILKQVSESLMLSLDCTDLRSDSDRNSSSLLLPLPPSPFDLSTLERRELKLRDSNLECSDGLSWVLSFFESPLNTLLESSSTGILSGEFRSPSAFLAVCSFRHSSSIQVVGQLGS